MSKLTDFLVALEEYREERYPFVSPGKKPPSHSCDNGLLFTAEAMILLSDLAYEEEQAVKGFLDLDVSAVIVKETMTWSDLVDACMAEPGLLRRYPFAQGDEQHDDYTGVAAAAKILNFPHHAQQILDYGEKHNYCWNVEKPGTFDPNFWFGRYPSFVPVLAVALGHSLDLMGQLACLGSFVAAARKADGKDSSEVQITYLEARVLEGSHWLVNLGIWYWRRKLMKVFPRGLKQVREGYFGELHPLARYAREDFK
jgi:hypothetical protein